MRRLNWLLAGALLVSLAPGADAQRRRENPIAIELEGTGGYTLVNLDSWVRPGQVTASERQITGGMARIFFVWLDAARLGVEGGRQHLFWYDVTADNLQRHVVINPWYGGLAVRITNSNRFFVDFGMGMYKINEKDVLTFNDNGLRLSTSVAAGINLINYAGVSLPVGIRVASIMDSRTAVLPVFATAGLAFRPFRGARGRP